jgi:hypothetical protein
MFSFARRAASARDASMPRHDITCQTRHGAGRATQITPWITLAPLACCLLPFFVTLVGGTSGAASAASTAGATAADSVANAAFAMRSASSGSKSACIYNKPLNNTAVFPKYGCAEVPLLEMCRCPCRCPCPLIKSYAGLYIPPAPLLTPSIIAPANKHSHCQQG